MKSFILATAMCFAITGGAAAQTADKQGEAGNAPTKSMDAAPSPPSSNRKVGT
jgi:hypothetical protein